MACRRCEAVMRRNGIQLSNIIKLAPRRTFTASATCFRRTGLPTFPETSSPALDSLLSTLRDKVFLPNAYLNQSQLKLISREKYKSELEASPVTITLGDEDIELHHLDAADLPNVKDLTGRILDLLSTVHDGNVWSETLPEFLRGFHAVGFGMNSVRMERVIRRAFLAGQFDAVKRSLHQVQHTGLSLKYPGVRYEVLWGIHELAQGAIEDAWSEDDIESATGLMLFIAKALESHHHGGGYLKSNRDPRISPAVLGLLLELHAARAYKFRDGADTDSSVKKYAERLMDALPRWGHHDFADAPYDSAKICFQVILWQALSLAQKVLGAEMPEANAATKKSKWLEEQVQGNVGRDLPDIHPHLYVKRMNQAWDNRLR